MDNNAPLDNNTTQTNAAQVDAAQPAMVAQPAADDVDQMSSEQLMDEFVAKMLEDKGLREAVDAETFEKMKGETAAQLNYEINRAILSQLPEDKLDEVEKALDDQEHGAETVDRIIEEAGIDVAKVTENTMLAFREGYLKGAEQEA